LDLKLLGIYEASLRRLVSDVGICDIFVCWEALFNVVEYLHVGGAHHEPIDPVLPLHLLLKGLETGEGLGSVNHIGWRTNACDPE
jgi:hypothetical protein